MDGHILLLLDKTLWHYSNDFALHFKNTIVACKRLFGSRQSYYRTIIDGELNHLGELTRIMGNNKVYSHKKIHPMYFNGNHKGYSLAEVYKYPSNFDFIEPSYIDTEEAIANITNFNAVICSYRSGEDAFRIVEAAKKRGVMVAMFDKTDHSSVYHSDRQNLYRGLSKQHFDIYFKQDLPSDCDDDFVYPIAPVPSAKLSLMNNPYTWNTKKHSIMFRGDYRKGVTRGDRLDFCRLVEKRFSDANISYSKNQSHVISQSALDDLLLASKFILSPSGKVWDSYRHCEMAKYGIPIILPKPDCKVVEPCFTDMENCVMYEVAYQGDDWRLQNGDELIQKLEALINNETECQRLATNYLQLVNKYHTKLARADYILKTLEHTLKG